MWRLRCFAFWFSWCCAQQSGASTEFGHPMLKEFGFPPLKDWINLNQGSYGACPIEVQQARARYQQAMESNPEMFFRVNITGDGKTVYADLMDEARAALAGYLNAHVDNIVLVENASHGLNAILRSLAKFLKAGTGMLYLDTAYGEVKQTFDYLAGRMPGEPSSPDLQMPTFPVAITDLMPNISRRSVIAKVEAALQANGSKVGFCSFSHITSTPGLVLPIEELTRACHKVGALVLIDGAHAPGQIPLNLTELEADFYVGDGHKWLFSPKGTAFIHVKPHAQRFVFAPVIEQGPDPTRFTSAFMWQGTRDHTSLIAIKDTVSWRRKHDVDGAFMKYMSSTAESGGQQLANMWRTSLMPTDPEERRHMQASLVNVRVPCGFQGEPLCPTDLVPQVVRNAKVFVPMGEYAGSGRGMWARVSASVYTEVSDFKIYGDAVLHILGYGATNADDILAPLTIL